MAVMDAMRLFLTGIGGFVFMLDLPQAATVKPIRLFQVFDLFVFLLRYLQALPPDADPAQFDHAVFSDQYGGPWTSPASLNIHITDGVSFDPCTQIFLWFMSTRPLSAPMERPARDAPDLHPLTFDPRMFIAWNHAAALATRQFHPELIADGIDINGSFSSDSMSTTGDCVCDEIESV